MDVLAGLTPMLVVGAAFVAIVVFVKRLADREAAHERGGDEAAIPAPAEAPPPGSPAAGPRVHMVSVDLDGDEDDGEKPPLR